MEDDNLIDLSSIQRKKVEQPEPKIQTVPDFDFGTKMDKSEEKSANSADLYAKHAGGLLLVAATSVKNLLDVMLFLKRQVIG